MPAYHTPYTLETKSCALEKTNIQEGMTPSSHPPATLAVQHHAW